jgi:hypothetical protein
VSPESIYPLVLPKVSMILVSDSGPYRTRDNEGLFQTGAFHRSGRLEFFETDYQGSYGRKLYTRTNQVKRDCLRKMSVATPLTIRISLSEG